MLVRRKQPDIVEVRLLEVCIITRPHRFEVRSDVRRVPGEPSQNTADFDSAGQAISAGEEGLDGGD